jgi:hypothetical protein
MCDGVKTALGFSSRRSPPIAYNDSDASIATAMQQIPGLNKVTVLRDTEMNALTTAALRFAVLDPPGDLPLLQVDSSDLTGPSVSMCAPCARRA